MLVFDVFNSQKLHWVSEHHAMNIKNRVACLYTVIITQLSDGPGVLSGFWGRDQQLIKNGIKQVVIMIDISH